MENVKALEQKLEELIVQLDELLVQLQGEDKQDLPQAKPQKTVENISTELQKLKRERTNQTQKNGWNYVSAYLTNKLNQK
jgi:hypothetical protein